MKRALALWLAACISTILLLPSCASTRAPAETVLEPLVPAPRSVQRGEGRLRVADGGFSVRAVGIEGSRLRFVRETVEGMLGAPPAAASRARAERTPVTLAITDAALGGREAYRLTVSPDGISVAACSVAGLQHGVMTLKQLVRLNGDAGALPCLVIDDWPEFANRGLLIDISRDRLPRPKTIEKVIDLLAELKYNQLQLYMEHTFAYAGHRQAWEGASPLTPADVRRLDAYCRDRNVELVPCQNSLGHMERWLKHERYEPLAEVVGGGTCLNPASPEAVRFVCGLYDQLLPCFSSRLVNICGDEALEIGSGRSADAVRARGVGRVYLDYLLSIRAHVARQGRSCQFWGDMLAPFDAELRRQRADFAALVPRDMTALVWGYRPDDPMPEQAAVFASACVPFYVCPGTSAWTSFVGRAPRMRGNVDLALRTAMAYGASGVLMTDWTIHGWEHLPFSLPGYVYAGAMAWNPHGNESLDLARCLDEHVFQDRAHVLGDVVVQLGSAYERLCQDDRNVPATVALMLDPKLEWSRAYTEGVSARAVTDTARYIMRTVDRAAMARPAHPEGRRYVREIQNGAELALVSCRLTLHALGRAEENGDDANWVGLPDVSAREAAERFRRLWLVRNRPGGLEASVERLLALARYLESSAEGVWELGGALR